MGCAYPSGRAPARSSLIHALQSLALVLLAVRALAADSDGHDSRAWKLTLGDYRYGDYSGADLNLRWQRADTHAWIGWYRDPIFGTQTRIGADTAIDLGHTLQLQPSVQLATQGFVGGSINLQAGDAWYAYAGIGRTNLRPFFNLNFDPNDAFTIGVGHRRARGDLYSLSVVRDDRLHTRQTDWHLTARVPLDTQRLTLDLLRKSGLGDVGSVSGWGFSVTYDWPTWLLRLARDPYQNFSAQNAWRLAIGLRF